MLKIYFIMVILVPTIIANYIIEEYSKEQILLQNMMNTVSHVINERPASHTSFYCVLLSAPPGGRPSSILNMLKLTQQSHIIVNIWPNVSKSDSEPRLRNCSDCQSYIIFTGMNDFEDVLNRVRVTCTGERIEFLVVICDIFESDAAAQKSAEFIVDLAWRQHRGFAIILIPVGSRVLILKSEKHLPYVKCRPEPPRVTSYFENATFVGKMSFKPFVYNKCVVRISSGTWWENVQLETINGTSFITGFEGLMIKTVAEQHNFIMDVKNSVAPEEWPSGTNCAAPKEGVANNSSCVREHLKSGKGDLAVCSLWITYSKDIKYSHSYIYHEVVLMIPVPLYLPFTSILNTFSKFVWICVILGLIIGRMLIRMNGRSVSSLMALALFIGVSVTSKSRGFVEKWQFMLWVIYGYLITQSYIASLVAVLNNPSVHLIETIDELAESDIRVAGYAPYRQSFEGIDAYKRIFDTFIRINQSEYTKSTNDPEKYIPPAKRIAVLVNSQDIERWRPRYYLFKQRMFYHLIGMAAITRSTVSLREIDKTILHLSEGGFLPRWYNAKRAKSENVPNFTDVERPSPTLSLKEETGIFALLAAGLFLSLLVFVYEVRQGKRSINNSQLRMFGMEINRKHERLVAE